MKVKLYVEGGGDAKSLQTRCREGFRRFFERAGLGGQMPAIVSCGSRNDAYGDFCTALRQRNQTHLPVLLVDSESSVNDTPWKHLEARDKWTRPDTAEDDQAQLMVQCMEAWFLADIVALKGFFEDGFVQKHVKNVADVESIGKGDVFNRLKMATRRCVKKGKYDKGEHSFKILALIDPARVRAASKHAERLISALVRIAGA